MPAPSPWPPVGRRTVRGSGPRTPRRGEAVAASANGGFVPLTPARVLDTRSGIGAPKAKVASHGTLSFDVAGQGGVPATGVSAVVLNVTVVAALDGSGYITAFPGGAPGRSSPTSTSPPARPSPTW